MDETFRDWLADRVGDKPKVSRRELAKRLAERTPGDGDPESYRRTVRRILDGETPNPKQRTRDAIQKALDDFTAPREGEEPDSPITKDEFRVWLRTNAKIARGVAVQT